MSHASKIRDIGGFVVVVMVGSAIGLLANLTISAAAPDRGSEQVSAEETERERLEAVHGELLTEAMVNGISDHPVLDERGDLVRGENGSIAFVRVDLADPILQAATLKHRDSVKIEGLTPSSGDGNPGLTEYENGGVPIYQVSYLDVWDELVSSGAIEWLKPGDQELIQFCTVKGLREQSCVLETGADVDPRDQLCRDLEYFEKDEKKRAEIATLNEIGC